MYSNLVPFENIIESVKDETGITNLRNLYPKIRRLVYRVERDIGYGGSVLLKKVKYSTQKKTILYDGQTYRLRLPSDIIHIASVGIGETLMKPLDYRIQGNFLFFPKKKKVDDIILIYYSLLCDGQGNPVTTENHSEAVTAGVINWLYRQRRFQDKGNFNQMRYYEEYYHDRLAEARGHDIMPSTMEEWAQAADIMNMSSRDHQIYLGRERDFTHIPFGIIPEPEVPDDGGTDPDPGGGGWDTDIWSFQFDSISLNISDHDMVTESWLGEHGLLHKESEMLSGTHINYWEIGRIGFAIKTDTPGKYTFLDILMTELNDLVFDNVYDPVRGLDIYISKEYYVESAVYYKFIKN